MEGADYVCLGFRLDMFVYLFVFLLRFETLEPEMNNLGPRVTDVNQVAEQLLKSDNRSKDQINHTQDQLNNRSVWTHTATATARTSNSHISTQYTVHVKNSIKQICTYS